jgi:hypothetical protein
VGKAKTLKMKLIYIIAAVAMLAMLIPAMAVPSSAATPPAVTTGAATLVGDTTALLNGTLTALGSDSPVALSFRYGNTLGGPYPYTAVGVPPSADVLSVLPLNFSALLTGLTINKTYYFQAKAVAQVEQRTGWKCHLPQAR